MVKLQDIIKDFSKLRKNDASIAGGKGASLGELTSAGIPVPGGFVVLSGAFEQFLKDTDLSVEIDAILHTIKHTEMHTVEFASEKIQALIQSAKMPEDIAQEIRQEFKKLRAEYVAVRSSATAEDSSSAAWAGQLDSFLNTTDKTLLINVQKCWASLFTPRAIFYRLEKELHKKKISVAVVVQKMIQSEKSGIAFSVHPVTEDHNQLIIEAGYGLGEAIVSGQITPDSYVVEKKPRRIIERHVVIQERGLYRKKDGGPPSLKTTAGDANEWRDISIETGKQQTLTNPEILELTELILKIENHYGNPQDIEWAEEDGKFYITQSRPITTLIQVPGEEIRNLEVVTSVAKWHEVHKRSRSPFFSGIFLGGLGVRKEYFPFDHRVHRVGIICDHVVIDESEKDRLFKRTVESLQREPNLLLKMMNRAYGEHRKCINKWRKNDRRDYSIFGNSALAAAFKGFVDDLFSFGIYVALPLFVEEYLESYIQESLFKRYGSEAQKWFGVASNPIKDGMVLDEEQELLKMAELKNIDWKRHIERFSWMANVGFFEKYYNLEYYQKRLNEFRKRDIKARLKKIKLERTKRNNLFAQLLKKVADDKYLLTIIQTANEAVFFRSYRTEIYYSSSFYNHNLLKEIGKRIGLSEYKEFVWFYWDEIYNAIKNGVVAERDLIAQRQKGYVFLSRFDKAYFHWDGQDAEQISELYERTQEVSSTKDEIRGKGAYPGVIKGKIVLVKDISELYKVKNGDILVTHATNINFVPVLDKVTAIITEEGGILSHASIISRELRIPCVMGIKNATKVLRDGDLVEVDAEIGVVRVLEKAHPPPLIFST